MSVEAQRLAQAAVLYFIFDDEAESDIYSAWGSMTISEWARDVVGEIPAY